jgi:threonine dehydratase
MSADATLWGGDDIATLSEIRTAQSVLADQYAATVMRTPLARLTEPLPVGGAPTDAAIFLKREGFQTTGSFKVRGMQYKMHTSDVGALRKSGVVTMSAGNAGKAVAHLARANGFAAKIFMPATAPDERKRLIESYGATVQKTPTPELLDSVARAIKEEGCVFVHPFDDVDIIRGHGSCGLEIADELPGVELVVVCCGGGGLLAGVGAAIKLSAKEAAELPADDARRLRAPAPHVRVVGVEPTGANSMWLSMQRGSEQWCDGGGKTDTVAHGLAPPFAGRACFRHAQRFVDEVVLVSDDELRAATRHLFSQGVVAEVSGAAAVAALMAGKCGSAAELAGKKVACVVSGRNVEWDEYSAAIGDLSRPMAHS